MPMKLPLTTRAVRMTKTMEQQEQVLYDSGRFPYWLRIPGTLIGFGMLYFGFNLAVYSLFGIFLPGIKLTPVEEYSATGFAFGFLVCMAIGILWSGMWFYRAKILFNPATRELTHWSTGWRLRIPYEGASTVAINCFHTFPAKTYYRVEFIGKDDERVQVYDMHSAAKAETLAQSLAQVTGLEIRREY